MCAVLQWGIPTVCGWIPKQGGASNTGSSVVLQYGVPHVGSFEISAHQPTVHFKIQTATQPTQFSDFQFNEAISSNQSTVTPSNFPTLSPNEPTPSTAATPTASAGRTVKASNLSPLPSVLKQGTSDARSYIPSSAPNWSRHHRWGALCRRTQPTQLSSVPLQETAGLSTRGEDRTKDVKPPVRRFLRARRRRRCMAEREWGWSWCRMFIVCGFVRFLLC
jgi:hypothetical protein